MEKQKRPYTDETKLESDKQFLDKNMVKESMSELISILSANRPKDPLQFMFDYFRSSYEQSNRLERSYQTIMLTHHSRAAFDRNLITAFEILNQTKLNKQVSGINGSLFDDLLGLVLRDVPEPLSSSLKSQLSRRTHDAISFETFQFTITSIMVVKDYYSLSMELFSMLDVGSTGSLDKQLTDIVLSLLKESLTQLSNNSLTLQSCYSLSPASLYKALSQIQRKSDGSLVTHKQFMDDASIIFLQLFNSKVSLK